MKIERKDKVLSCVMRLWGFYALLAFAATCALIQGWRRTFVLPIGTQDDVATLMAARDIMYFVCQEPEHSLGLAIHGCGYPILIRLATFFFRNDMAAAVMLSLVASAAFLLCVFWLLRKLHSSEMAWFTVTMVAIMPEFVTLSSSVNDTMVSAALALFGAYSFVLSLDGKQSHLCYVCGALYGLAALVRNYYLAWVLFTLAYVAFVSYHPIKGRLASGVKVAASFLLVITPLGLITWKTRGDFFYIFSHASGTLAFNVLDKTNSFLCFIDYGREYRSFVDVIRHHPMEVLHYGAKNVYYFFSGFLLEHFLLIGVLSPIGLFLVLKKLDVKRIFILMIGVLTVASLCMTNALDQYYRYLLVCVPFFVALAYVALNSECFPDGPSDVCGGNVPILRPFGVWSWRGLVKGVMYAFFLCQLARSTVQICHEPGQDDIRVWARTLGRSLSGSGVGKECSTIYSIAYYGGLRHVPLSCALPRDQAFESIRDVDFQAAGVRYVAYVRGQSAYEYPKLSFLLDPRDPRVPSSFRLVTASENAPIRLYEVVPRSSLSTNGSTSDQGASANVQ